MCNSQPSHAAARSPRPAARHGVRARRPRAGEGRPRRSGATYLDELLGDARGRATTRRATDFERVLKQRNALLRSGVRDDDGAHDARRVRRAARAGAAAELVRGRLRLVERLGPAVARRVRRARGRRSAGRRDATRRSGRPGRSTIADTDAVEDHLRDALARAPAGRDRPRPHAGRSAPRRLAARRSTGSTRGRRRRRASSARSRSRCGSRATSRARAHRARRRSCCSTTCSASSTRTASSALVRNLPAGQTLLTTAGVIPPDVAAGPGARGSSRDASSRDARDARRKRATNRCRCATRSRRSGSDLGMPAARRARRARRRCGRRSSVTRVAAHAPVRSVRDGVCTVEVDGPVWATQLRYARTTASSSARDERLRAGRRDVGSRSS